MLPNLIFISSLYCWTRSSAPGICYLYGCGAAVLHGISISLVTLIVRGNSRCAGSTSYKENDERDEFAVPILLTKSRFLCKVLKEIFDHGGPRLIYKLNNETAGTEVHLCLIAPMANEQMVKEIRFRYLLLTVLLVLQIILSYVGVKLLDVGFSFL